MFSGEATWRSGAIAAHVLEAFLEDHEGTNGIPAMPESVVQLLRQCFAENESDRPHTMMEVADRLIVIFKTECGKTYPGNYQNGASETADSLSNKALSYLDLGDEGKAENF